MALHGLAFHPARIAAPAPSPARSAIRWLHEVKFDGYRIQVHKAGRDVTLLSRNGHAFTGRFPEIAFLLGALPAKAV